MKADSINHSNTVSIQFNLRYLRMHLWLLIKTVLFCIDKRFLLNYNTKADICKMHMLYLLYIKLIWT